MKPWICATIAFLVLQTVGQTSETDWLQHVIPVEERSFDFKTVAKGTAPEHLFVLKNPFQEPIHIKSVTSSCTCTTVDFDQEQSVLQTYEEIFIAAKFRGDMLVGHRNATLTVVIDKPNHVEIQLNVRGEIRADLHINPNFIDFGNVELEQESSRTLTVTYTGSNSQWRLVDAKCENEFIHTEITSDLSLTGIGVKVFKVNVSLDKSAPPGSVNSHLFLISNDLDSRREIPILIRAMVGTIIKITPPTLFLGLLPPGTPTTTKPVILSGTNPFNIIKIECDNPAIEIPLKINANDPPKMRYSVPILYRNPVDGEGSPKGGVMQASVRITTDIPGLSSTFYVTMRVQKEENEELSP